MCCLDYVLNSNLTSIAARYITCAAFLIIFCTELLSGVSLVRRESLIFGGVAGGTGSAFGDVWMGGKSVGLVVAESDDGPLGGWTGVCARCRYDR